MDFDLDYLLDHSRSTLESYQTQLKGTTESQEVLIESTGDSLDELVTLLAGTSSGLKKILRKGSAAPINGVKLAALQQAIQNMIQDSSTENKIEAIQIAVFGMHMPLLRALRETQKLLLAVERLKESRGKKTAHIDEMDGLGP